MSSTNFHLCQLGNTALIWACKEGNLTTATMLVNNGANIEARGEVCTFNLENVSSQVDFFGPLSIYCRSAKEQRFHGPVTSATQALLQCSSQTTRT
jgi:ankyrin repeat protein